MTDLKNNTNKEIRQLKEQANKLNSLNQYYQRTIDEMS